MESIEIAAEKGFDLTVPVQICRADYLPEIYHFTEPRIPTMTYVH